MADSLSPDLLADTVGLLKQLITIPSFSREEDHTATCLLDFLRKRGVNAERHGHNIWARSGLWREDRPTLLLNSHHDTVRPAAGWTRDPFQPQEEAGRLYGLGSNDAGGPLVALIATFLQLQHKEDLAVNLLLAASAEEEISGAGGIASLLPQLPPIWAGIVGEPTRMQMAVAEKGLMVIDGEAIGQSGHAAREEGINAIYLALEDIELLRKFQFEKISPLLGPVKVSVTQIEAGRQHNVVPDRCRFVVDVRTNECYSNEEAFDILQQLVGSRLQARSFRLNSSRIEADHPLVCSGRALGFSAFGSPTLSDQALMRFPTLKIGPGDSARSHTADEYIGLAEIKEGVEGYVRLVEGLKVI